MEQSAQSISDQLSAEIKETRQKLDSIQEKLDTETLQRENQRIFGVETTDNDFPLDGEEIVLPMTNADDAGGLNDGENLPGIPFATTESHIKRYHFQVQPYPNDPTQVRVTGGKWVVYDKDGAHEATLNSAEGLATMAATLGVDASNSLIVLRLDMDDMDNMELTVSATNEAPSPSSRYFYKKIATVIWDTNNPIWIHQDWTGGNILTVLEAIDAREHNFSWKFTETGDNEGEVTEGYVLLGGVQQTITDWPANGEISIGSGTTHFWIEVEARYATVTWKSGTSWPANTDTEENYRILEFTSYGSNLEWINRCTNDIHIWSSTDA